MPWKVFLRRLRAPWRPDAVHDEIAEELAFHLERRTAENIEAGMPPEEARRDAQRRFGHLTQTHEAGYDARTLGWLESLVQDLRYGGRMLRRSPVFTLVAVLMISFGIGVNATIFSLVDWMYLRPVPVKDATQIVYLVAEQKDGGYRNGFSYPNFEEIQNQTSSVFTQVVGTQPFQMDGLTVNGSTKTIWTSYVTGNFFEMLGVPPLMGRYIVPSDGGRSSAEPVVYLSYSCWQKRFGSDPEVVGKQVTVNGRPLRVIGVAPKGMRGLLMKLDTDTYLPYGMAGMNLTGGILDDTGHPIEMLLFARLKPGVSMAQAQSVLDVVAKRMAESHPKEDPWKSMRAVRLGSSPPSATPFNPGSVVSGIFLSLGGLVLLLCCVNIANLLLVRSGIRAREMAVRSALGAGRTRLIRQMLTESTLLALLGCAGGVALCLWAHHEMRSIQLSAAIPVILDMEFNWRVFAYSLGAALVTGVVVGVMPALRGSKTNLADVLHSGGRGATAGRQRLRSLLVTAEVSGSLMLLIVAGLFVRSLESVQRADLGFDTDHVLNLSFNPHQAGYDEQRARQFLTELVARVSNTPGVQGASVAASVPMGIYSYAAGVKVDGSEPANAGLPLAGYNPVTAGYFTTMGIPLLRGRTFTGADDENAPRVAVINQAMADRFWKNQDPIGRSFTREDDPARPVQVVGIAKNSQTGEITDPIGPFFYVPLAQRYSAPLTLQVRFASGDPAARAQEIAGIVRSMDPSMPLFDIQTMRRALDTLGGLLLFRIGAEVSGGLGAIGLMLALIGVYGVVSYSVSQRTQEIGVRMALGARPADILGSVLRQGLLMVGLGVVIGAALAAGLTRVMANILVGVQPMDPLTFGGASLLLLGISVLASYVPARRATRVDPMVALRHE